MMTLIRAPFQALLWGIRTVLSIAGSPAIAVAACFGGFYLIYLGRWTLYDFGGWWIVVCGVCLVSRAMLNSMAPARRRGRAISVPLARVLAKPGDAPTARQAVGRLSPALRQLLTVPGSA